MTIQMCLHGMCSAPTDCAPSKAVACAIRLLQGSCLRYQVASRAPESMETATCVMPKVLKDGKCRWYDRRKVVVWASGFAHLYDCVMKKDYTSMRKGITSYLHGPKTYYEYMRGERPLSPEQQQWIQDFVKSFGYEWELSRTAAVDSGFCQEFRLRMGSSLWSILRGLWVSSCSTIPNLRQRILSLINSWKHRFLLCKTTFSMKYNIGFDSR